MLCTIQMQVSGFKDFTASPPLQPIVLVGNNAIMVTAQERPVSHPSNSPGPDVASGLSSSYCPSEQLCILPFQLAEQPGIRNVSMRTFQTL